MILSLPMSFIKDFKKFLLSQEGMNFYNFPYLSNHSLALFLDLLTAVYTIDAKVDHPSNYSYLLRMFKRTKLTSNLIELNSFVLGLGIHWIRILLQVWKVLDLVSLVFLPPLFGIDIYLQTTEMISCGVEG